MKAEELIAAIRAEHREQTGFPHLSGAKSWCMGRGDGYSGCSGPWPCMYAVAADRIEAAVVALDGAL